MLTQARQVQDEKLAALRKLLKPCDFS